MLKSFFFPSVLFFTCFIAVPHANAQSISTPAEKQKNSSIDSLSSDTAEAKRSLLLEFDYGSNSGYQLKRKISGADTSASQKYIAPSLTYSAESGFFTSVSFYKTPGAKKSWDEFLFGLGWDFKISERANVKGSVGYMHFTYNQAIKKNDANPANSDLSAYVKHDFDFIALKLNADYYFGGTYNDEDIIFDIDHAFYIDDAFAKKDELSIDPMFSIVGSTLNFYITRASLPDTTSITANTPKKKKELIALRQAVLNDLNTFRIANYEFSLPVNYEIGKFDFELAYRYYIPANLPAILNATPIAKSYSYVTALVSYDFLK